MLDESFGANPAAAAERAETTEMIFRALRGLPAGQREIIILHEIEDLDYETIADILNCSRASVKLRLFRARRSLRERVTSLLESNGKPLGQQ